MVYRWIDDMLNNQGLAGASINHYLRDFRTFFYWCQNKDYTAETFKIKNIKTQEEKLKLYTDDELEALLQKPKNADGFPEWRQWAIVNFILATGARAGTIADIKVSDIDFQKKEITYSHTKNKKAQVVPLSSSLENCLREYIRIWRGAPYGYLFCNIGEEKITTDALKHAHASYCKRREVKQTSLHALRHTFAKGWIQNNGNSLTLQKVLGHSSLDMTRRYVKLFTEDIKQGYDDFSPLDNIKKDKKRTFAVKKNK